MSHLRVLICRVEDDPKEMAELHRFDLPRRGFGEALPRDGFGPDRDTHARLWAEDNRIPPATAVGGCG